MPLAKNPKPSGVKMENQFRLTTYTKAGTQQDLFQLLQDYDMNTILRVWVNPAGGRNGPADVLAKATRAHALGYRLLIDFHYSISTEQVEATKR